MSIKEWLSKLNILDPRRVKVLSAHLDTIDLEINRKIYTNVIPKKPFPFSRPFMVIFYTSDEVEIGILKDYRKMDNRSRELLEKVLNRIYFMPIITKILKIDFSGGKYRWIVKTDKGKVEFETKGSCVRVLNNGVIIIKDIHGNVYKVENPFKLDAKSLSLLSAFI